MASRKVKTGSPKARPKARPAKGRAASAGPAKPPAPASKIGSEDVRRPTIVALGASAGGLAVYERFLHLMPRGGNLAFLIVSHLDPSQVSLLPELLASHTALSVEKAENGARIAADHVYVIPPDRYMTVADGTIRLSKMTDPRGSRFPIDVLLRSLGEDQKENAIAVILTGTGRDGTEGLRAIKDAGGVVIVQDPQSVEYPGMPTSAIATGSVDFVLRVEEMPRVIMGYARHFSTKGQVAKPGADSGAPADLKSVITALKARGDPLDYRSYKPGTLLRRIHRRMGLAQLDDIADYVELLRDDAKEVERLRGDLLITVTSFFRDPEAWSVFEAEVVPQLFKDRPPDAPIRVWVPGCSTGEEAYSIAMLLIERRRSSGSAVPIQVFATDYRSDLLEVARAALYDKSSLAQIPSDRLSRFFTEESPDRYRATKELREVVAFAVQDLLSDPPFSKMDVVSCRNVLIYFLPEAQKRIIGLFHFALKPGGFLFLGGSEGIAPHEREFEAISKKWRLYRRSGKTRAGVLAFPTVTSPAFPVPAEPRRGLASAAPANGARDARIAETARRWLVDEYAPAAVVVDSRDDIQHIHGGVGAFLEFPQGEPVYNLVAMVPASVRGRLRVALHKARTTGDPAEITVSYPGLPEGPRIVRVKIQDFLAHQTGEPLLIVTFESVSPEEAHASNEPPTTQAEESIVRQMEAELAATKADLQGTIEALETANEELRASNEEIMSMNEEFRSTNEELETSKEELQSLNEELSAVNSQLNEKVQSLDNLTNDLTNLFASTEIPILFLDAGFHIRRFTPPTKTVLNLIPSDVGRPLSDISMNVKDETLVGDVHEVLRSLTPVEKEIRAHSGRRYLRRIRPYRTQDNRIDGVAISFVDVETMKVAEDQVRAAARFAEAIVETVRSPLLVLDARLHVKSANPAFYTQFQTTPEDTLGRGIFSLGARQWDIPALREMLERELRKSTDIRDQELHAEFERIGARSMLINSRRLPAGAGGDDDLILLAIEDITERVRSREALEERVKQRTAELERSIQDLRHVNESLDAFSHVVGHDLKEPARAVESLLHVLQQDYASALPSEARKLLGDARAANERLSRLIGGLLALSRASRIDFPHLRAVGIAESLANEACKTRYEALLVERRAQVEPPEPDVLVHATPDSLCQILGNLIVNAVKHNPRAEPRVHIRAIPRGEMVEVVVEDNGPGFPADLVAGFENMSSTTRGFGLIIARRTAENLGGRMWLAKAEIGGGAVHFTLRTPPRQV